MNNFIDLKQLIVEKLTEIGFQVDIDTEKALRKAQSIEESELSYDVLFQLCKNIDIAKERNFPLCQDTGLVVFWVKIGEQIIANNIFNSLINGMSEYRKGLSSLLNQAVMEAFQKNNFRHSVVKDPIDRKNTNNNTPAIIHYEFTEGNSIEISMMLKGGGSENMSSLKMLKPSDGIQGIRDFVLNVVKNSGGNACPPLTIGVGIGGNFETCALLAKKSLFRKPNEKNNSEFWAKEESFLLKEINKLNIGPMGFGGKSTALKVHIETLPCHIASLPVAVNLECHAHRLSWLTLSDL